MNEGLLSVDAPLLGRSVAVGIFSLLHIALAALGMGFMVLAPIAEVIGRHRPHYTDAAHSMTRFTLVTFTASLVLAVIMIELFIGLFPLTNTVLFNRFRVAIFLGIAAFLAQLFLLYPYYHYWERIRLRSLRLHIALGSTAALLMLVWVLMLDGIGSFMLTPVQGDSQWELLLNPTWLPLALHRFIGNFVIAGYAAAGYAAWRLRDAAEHDRAYYRQVAAWGFVVGLVAFMLQPVTGFVYAHHIEEAVPDAYRQVVSGPFQPLVYIQFSLIGVLFLGSHIILGSAGSSVPGKGWLLPLVALAAAGMVLSVGFTDLRRLLTFCLAGLTVVALVMNRRRLTGSLGLAFHRPRLRWMTAVLAVVSLLIYLTMGTIRETARRPYTIQGIVTLQEEAETPAAFRD